MYRRVLVPLDGSQFAEGALEHLSSVAQVAKLESVVLVRVVMPLLVHAKDYIEAEAAREAEDKQEAAARRYLEEVAARLRKQGMPAKTVFVLDGEPAMKILETAREHEVDLIIMSSHGTSGFAPWLFGSVTERVLSHSAVPVLMVVSQGTRTHRW